MTPLLPEKTVAMTPLQEDDGKLGTYTALMLCGSPSYRTEFMAATSCSSVSTVASFFPITVLERG